MRVNSVMWICSDDRMKFMKVTTLFRFPLSQNDLTDDEAKLPLHGMNSDVAAG